MKKIFLLLPVMLYLMACEKTIDLNIPVENPKLVMHAYLNPDSTFKVQLNKSAYILDDREESRKINDATVQVFEEDKALGSMEPNNNGWYELKGIKPKVGMNYRIEASRAGMEKIVASERVLQPGEVFDISVDTIGMDEYGHLELEISFSIQDEPGENFYISRGFYNATLKVWDQYSGEEYLHTYNSPFSQQLEDPALESFCYNSCISIMRDTFFDGKTYKIRLRGSLPTFHGEYELMEESLSVQVYNVTDSYYRYHASLEQNRQSSYDPFAEPSLIYSNVVGGYGILGAITITKHKIERR